jgi:hypothetical protein
MKLTVQKFHMQTQQVCMHFPVHNVQAQVHSCPTYVPYLLRRWGHTLVTTSLPWLFQLHQREGVHEVTDRACSLVTPKCHLVPLQSYNATSPRGKENLTLHSLHTLHSPWRVCLTEVCSLPYMCASLGISLSLSLSLS